LCIRTRGVKRLRLSKDFKASRQASRQDEAGRQMTWLNKRGPEIGSRSRSPFNVVFSL